MNKNLKNQLSMIRHPDPVIYRALVVSYVERYNQRQAHLAKLREMQTLELRPWAKGVYSDLVVAWDKQNPLPTVAELEAV